MAEEQILPDAFAAEILRLREQLGDSARQLAQVTQQRDAITIRYVEAMQRAEHAEAQCAELDLLWNAASRFIRAVIDALALAQPPAEGVVNLPELTLQVVGQLEELKAQCAALRAALEQTVADWQAESRITAEGSRAYDRAQTLLECATDLRALLTTPPQEPAKWNQP